MMRKETKRQAAVMDLLEDHDPDEAARILQISRKAVYRRRDRWRAANNIIPRRGGQEHCRVINFSAMQAT